jgi:hypothetical protein
LDVRHLCFHLDDSQVTASLVEREQVDPSAVTRLVEIDLQLGPPAAVAARLSKGLDDRGMLVVEQSRYRGTSADKSELHAQFQRLGVPSDRHQRCERPAFGPRESRGRESAPPGEIDEAPALSHAD